MARLLSVNVGLPRDIAWKGRTVHTGIWKTPVGGRCRVGRLNLDGDGQGDLAGHGGEQRAVFVYDACPRSGHCRRRARRSASRATAKVEDTMDLLPPSGTGRNSQLWA